mgnify:CR=1 FL=1
MANFLCNVDPYPLEMKDCETIMPTVIYDPQCVVCNDFCKWIADHPREVNVSFVAPASAAQASSIVWIDDSGDRVEGSKAVLLAVSMRQGLVGRVAGILARLPVQHFLDPFYYSVARNRSRLGSFLLKIKKRRRT